MQSMQQQQGGRSAKDHLNTALFVARALAVSVEVFLHDPTTFGARYLGPQVLVTLLVMLCFPALWPGADPEPMRWFLGLFLVLCGAAQAAIASRRRRGKPDPHSYYNGVPLLLKLPRPRWSKVTEEDVKGYQEPAVVGLVGVLLIEANRPLSVYLMLAAVAMFLMERVAQRVTRNRLLDLQDAQLEQRSLVERFRKQRGR
jgi:hypothetical protein